MHKLVALITDFGTEDHYVAVVKARILSEVSKNPDLSVCFIDITHEVPPQDVLKACVLLSFSYEYFPEGTIFLAVVDPGVGTERKAVLLKTPKYTFIGPDNGLFTLVLEKEKEISCYEIIKEKVMLPPFSTTFHARDLFAPAVAKVILNEDFSKFCSPIEKENLVRLNICLASLKRGERVKLEVLCVDRFGNVVTNLHKNDIRCKKFTIEVNGKPIPFVKTYAEAKPGDFICLFGSEGFLEIAVNQGSAKDRLKPADEIIAVCLGEKDEV